MLDRITPFGLISLGNFITCVAIAIFILIKSRRSAVNLSYSIFDFCIAFYAFFYFLWQSSTSAAWEILFFKWCIFGVVLINSAFVHFTAAILGLHKKFARLLIFIHAINSFFCYASLFLFYAGWKAKYTYGLWPIPSTTFHAYLVWWFLQVGFCFFLIYKYGMSRSEGKQRSQFKWIFWSTLIAYTGGSTNWLVWYDINFPPYLNSGIAVYTLVLSYAIFRYQILDIEVIIRRTLVFAGLAGSVVAVVSLVAFVSQDVLGHYIGISRAWSNVFAAIIIAALYGTIRDWLVNVTEKYLFQKPYDYKQLLKEFTDEVVTVLDLRKLVAMTTETLERTMKIESVGLWLLNRVTNRYELAASKGFVEQGLTLEEKNPLVKFLQKTQEPVVREHLRQKENSGLEVMGETLAKLKAEVCLPLAMREEMVGILTLGKKKSDEPYAKEDLETLTALAKTEAVAISNALLVAESAQKEKLAIIGTLASAINHEVCNPLNNIKVQAEGMLLQLKRGFLKDVPREELETKVAAIMQNTMQEVDRAAAITTRLSNFSKPAREPVTEPVDVNKVADEVFSLLGHDLELREIKLEKVIPPEVPLLFVDHRQLQEILFNLIRNSGQAIGQKGTVTLRAGMNGSQKVAIEIVDTGCGIPPENLQRLFVPFFTTKGEGKGTGLGLFVIKRLVERNEGTISVKSEVGVGTTFTVEFPVAVAQAQAKAG